MIRKAINYISANFFLRNLVLAICGIIIFVFIVSLLLGAFTRHGQRLIVPDLSNMNVNEAKAMCDDKEMVLTVIDSLYAAGQPAGTILYQSPDANMTVKSGRKIFVIINSTHPRMDFIPYVTGYSLRQAKNMIENKGFEIARITYVSDIATNNVLSQNYKQQPITAPNQVKAEMGQGVNIIVGRNNISPLPLVPKLIGLSLREAKSRIWEMGLNVGEIKADRTLEGKDISKGKIYRQIPNQQMRADYGAPITLFITMDTEKITAGDKASDSDARQFVEVDTISTENQILEDLGITKI